MLLFIVFVPAVSAQEHLGVPEKFVGKWSCVYTSATDPAKYAPRARVWRIEATGESTATGRYPADHSTGIQGRYRSKLKLNFQNGSFTQALTEYNLIDPIRNGEPMSDPEIADFERQVMSGKPVAVDYVWLSSNAFRTLSQYTDMNCERAEEANS
ncbi:MAG: hypothetical protein AAF642_11170 [Pseudomonadota bacterium]